ncbi:MAG: DUF4114 domain-containing protein [Prevotellaceae bacterium]|nr:DUF4114 domain-containing protein [Prevotellaceae bacterium]
MKIKSLLSFFVPAAMMSLAVAGCSDYDNGYSEQAIKFAQDFRKTFGDIDPEQDWNLAERGTVTVSTMKESEVKIYALTGDEYTIVGDYEGVKGTRMLGFDMVEGTKEIVVTDGATAQKTVPGGVVTFGGTRFTVHEGTREGVTVSRFTNETEINGKTYPAQKTPTENEIKTVLEKVPEYAPNLNNVTCNFQYVSTGSFVLYPYYWNTSSINTLGVYYTDANNQYHEVDIYTLNGEESGYVEDYNVYDTNNDVVTSWEPTGTATDKDGHLYRRPNDWHIDGIDDSNFYTLKKNGWTGDDPVLQKPFIEYWVEAGTGIGTKTIIKNVYRTFTAGNKYLVEVKARLINQESSVTNDNKGTITFSANDNKVILTDDASSTIKNGVLYSDMDGLEKIWVVCTADSEGKITLKFELNNVQCNWFAFNGMKIYDVSEMTKTGDNFYTSPERGKGIRVDIPEGTTFGMYLKKTETGGNGNTHSYTFYSESYKNDPNKVGSGVTVTVNADGEKTKTQQPGTNPCYASTFKMPVTQDGDDKMFLGFEDWPNIYGVSDFDLNDVVFAFDGCQPIIVNEEPDKWLLACEDLGGSFDIDYNDVVFSVEHVSGKTKAKLTPLAAGGTLASYIYFQDPWDSERDKCFGEIHQLFGATNVNSGEFSIINAKSRYEKTAAPIEFEVDENWTMAYYSTGESGGTNYGGDVNMGGFEIRTLKSGEDAPFELGITSEKFSGASKIQPSTLDRGENVPYILCLPYSYKHFNYNRANPEAGKKTVCVWAWPTEFTTICNENGTSGPYKDFAGWVQNKNNNTDWYKNKDYQNADAATVENLYLSVSNMTQAEINGNSGNGGNNGGNGGNNQKQASNLSVQNGSTTKDTGINLKSCVTTSSTGNITYKVYNGDFLVETKTKAYNEEYTFTPDRTGTLTIKVTQAADDNYEASSEKSFTVTVNEANGGGNQGGTLSYTKSAMTLEADGNDFYTTGSTGHKYAITGSQFSSYSGAITIKITGFTGNNIKAFIGTSAMADGFTYKNSGDTWTIELSAAQVESIKQNGFVLKSSGEPTLVVVVEIL